MAPKSVAVKKRSRSPPSSSKRKPAKSQPRTTSSYQNDNHDDGLIQRAVPTGSGVFKKITTPPPPPACASVQLNFLKEDNVNVCLNEIMQWLLINPRCLGIYFEKQKPNSATEKSKVDSYMRQVLKNISPQALYTLHYESNCAVFDIDDTIIKSTSPESRPELVDPAILQLYYLLLGRGWHIFFVTARTEDPEVRDFTEKQLAKLGFHVNNNLGPSYGSKAVISNLILMPEATDLSADECNFSYYKYYARRKLRERGYKIGINIGDNYNDLLITPPWIYDSTLAYDTSGPHGCMMNTIQQFIFFGSPHSRQVVLSEHNGCVIIFGIEDAVISVKLPAVD